jgi:hypothetical protein
MKKREKVIHGGTGGDGSNWTVKIVRGRGKESKRRKKDSNHDGDVPDVAHQEVL